MPETGRAGPASRRVRDVVGADDQRDVSSGELRVDVLHLLELRIGHVRLREQHVHVPRHPAGDRVDRVLHVDAALLEQLGQLADGVLGLGDREAVARDHDHVLGVGQLDRDVVRADRADRAARPGRGPGGVVAATEPADHDVHDRPVHGVGHELGQDRTRGPDEGAGDDQHRVVDHEARHRHGRAGERVQQRDDDRHVGAADRQGHRHAEDQGRGQDDEHQREVRRAGDEQEQRGDDGDAGEGQRHELAARDDDRLARDQALELARRDDRAGERDRADDDVEDDEDVVVDADRARRPTRRR